MASIRDRLTRLTRSPQAQKLVDQAKAQAAKPENRERIEKVAQRLRRR